MKQAKTAWALRGGIETDWQCDGYESYEYGLHIPYLYKTRERARSSIRNADIKLKPVRVRVTVEVEEV